MFAMSSCLSAGRQQLFREGNDRFDRVRHVPHWVIMRNGAPEAALEI